MTDQRLILGLLLDRYERSRHMRAPGQSPRGIFLRYDRSSLPDYWDERRAERRLELNAATEALADRGLVSIRRSRYSAAEIERVDLNLERVAQAYQEAGRTPRRAVELQLAEVARRWAERWGTADWRGLFAATVAEAAQSGSRLPGGLPAAEPAVLDELCRVLEHLGPHGLPREVPRRILSQRLLGASKRLEELQPRLARCLREFGPPGLPDSDRALLAEFGIVENPQYVYLAGPVRLGGIDLGEVGTDLGLPTALIDRCRVEAVQADQVLTVENLTSFHQVVAALPARTVAVYLGGYHNRVRRELLRKLAEAGVSRFFHWGDIDLGGFRIALHLAGRSGLPIRPLLMDVQTYRRYASAGMEFDDRYARELAAAQAEPAYAAFRPVIQEMLQHRRRVEQEAMDFELSEWPQVAPLTVEGE